MLNIKRLFIVLSVLLFVSTSIFGVDADVLYPGSNPTSGDSYLYGIFELRTLEGAVIGSTASISILIENVDTEKKYRFVLSNRKEMLQVMELDPGNYSITSVEYLSKSSYGGYRVEERDDFDFNWYKKSFTLKPNTAIYLGDFIGRTYQTTEGSAWSLTGSVSSYTHYELDNPVENFIEATNILKVEYPGFDTSDINFSSNIATYKERGYINIKDIMTPEDYAVFLERVSSEDSNSFRSGLSPEAEAVFNSLSPQEQAQIQALMDAAKEMDDSNK